MKKVLFLLMIPVLCFGQYTSIPDQSFEHALIKLGYDDFIDGKLLNANINTVDSLFLDDNLIQDLTGVEAFTALKYLSCSWNAIYSLDVSKNTALTYLDCGINRLYSLDLSNNTALTDLDCNDNKLTNLDVSKNTALSVLYCSDNQLTSLDVSKNTALTDLSCGSSKLTNLDLSNNTVKKNSLFGTGLTDLDCDGNKFDCDAIKAKYGIKNNN